MDNQTSLTAGLSTMPSCGANVPGPLGRPGNHRGGHQLGPEEPAAVSKADALVTPVIPAAMSSVAAEWAAWLKLQHTTGGTSAVPDYANPEQMNRYDWYVNSNFTTPYPGDSKIYAPNEVPGVYLASADTGG